MSGFQNDPEFNCLRCGKCCRWHGYILISEKEAESISEFLRMDLAEFYENMTMPSDDDDVSLTENEDGSCPFYVDSPPGCKIYECRPSQCRTYPLEWSNKGKDCPGRLPKTESSEQLRKLVSSGNAE